MALANVSNGAMSLVDPTAGQLDPTIAPQPVWISLTLLALGLGTLVAVVPAWRGIRTALWVVVVTRLVEAWSALMLPSLPGAPSGMWPFIVALIAIKTFLQLIKRISFIPFAIYRFVVAAVVYVIFF